MNSKRIVLALVLIVAIEDPAAAQDATGDWEFTYSCAGDANGTTFTDVTGSYPAFGFSPDTNCGSGRLAGSLNTISSCTNTPDPAVLLLSGSGTFSTSPVDSVRIPTVPYIDPSTACGTSLIDELRSTFSASGTYVASGGLVTEISGSVTFSGMYEFWSLGSLCASVDPSGFACTIEGRRNGVPTPGGGELTPTEGVAMLVDVTTPGEVYVTALSESTMVLPVNFEIVDPPMYYSISTTAVIDSVIACFSYPDDDNDGYVDGTMGVTPEGLQLLRNGNPISITWLEKPKKRICAGLFGFSEFAVGYYVPNVPSMSPASGFLIVATVGIAAVLLLRRRLATS